MAQAIFGVIGVIGAFVLPVIVIGLLLAWPLMLLWNGCLVDAVTGVQEVTLLQMWGIQVLLAVLFKSSSKSSN